RRGLITTAIAAVATAAGVAAIALRPRRDDATERLRLAQEVGQEMEQIEADLRVAYMQPLHDVRPEQATARARMAALEPRLAAEGDLGEGAGEYALGRGYLALHDLDRAAAHLLAAERRGYETPDVERSLGIVLGLIYERMLAASDDISDPQLSKERRAVVE